MSVRETHVWREPGEHSGRPATNLVERATSGIACSLPFDVRWRAAFDHELARALARIAVTTGGALICRAG